MPSSGNHTLGSSSSSYGASAAPAEDVTTTEAPLPRPANFRLQVIKTSDKCFGSAGCSVEYRIVPTWVGPGSAPTSASYTLLYEVIGLDSPQSGSIAVTNGRFATESGSGDDQGNTLTARVTQVLDD
jgi:hypothetical protein